MRIVISIYNPPELYPPTLHAVELLAKQAETVTIVTRNIICKHYSYPSNVQVIRTGKHMSMNEAIMQGQVRKMMAFVQYVWTLSRSIKKTKSQIWLGYDLIGLYTLYLAKKWGAPKPKVFWYHNHDVQEPGNPSRKYSIAWWAERSQQKAFDQLDIFSLPSAERLKYFPSNNWKGKYFVTPNYPLRSLYERIGAKNSAPGNELAMIYQGRISADHGFEEIIPVLNNKVAGKDLKLTLIGIVSDEYKESLTNIARTHNTQDKLHFLKPVAYEDLMAVTATHHVGLAIHKPASVIYSTGGTASNKIYEYAAVGLPVLLFDNEHYKKYLQHKRWAFFTDCTAHSMMNELQAIAQNYNQVSEAAKHDFATSLNYEVSFQPVMKEVFKQALAN